MTEHILNPHRKIIAALGVLAMMRSYDPLIWYMTPLGRVLDAIISVFFFITGVLMLVDAFGSKQ